MQRKLLTLKGLIEINEEKPEENKPLKDPFEEAKDWLCTQFPKAFDFKSPKPLKVGVHQDLWASYSALSPNISKRKDFFH